MATGGLSGEFESYEDEAAGRAGSELGALVRQEDLVGDLLKIDYGECEVLVHDHSRQQVGGIPLGCFLLATRLRPAERADPRAEDTGLILLRVVGQTRLPNASETDNNRFLAGQRVATLDQVWDAEDKTDQFTLHQLRYAGVSCRVLGTFRVRETAPGEWKVVFGADISNFYSGRGMKVYKPVGPALSTIVNFSTAATDDSHALAGARVTVGRVRYASSERLVDPAGEAVAVELDPTDLVARRTALFGMSRTGKSNTTKVIAASVFRLRDRNADRGRVGQLIFDVNGEYANENTQDGTGENAACLKNVAQHARNARPGDVATYGLTHHPADPGRKIVKINFYGGEPRSWEDTAHLRAVLEPLLVGKRMADEVLRSDTTKYMGNFRNTPIEVPEVLGGGATIRFKRWIAVYRAVLSAAGFRPPSTGPRIKGLFGTELRKAMASATTGDAPAYAAAAAAFAKEQPGWAEFVEACKALRRFIEDAANSGFAQFAAAYRSGKDDGSSWEDETLNGILAIFQYPNGPRALRPLLTQHDPSSVEDYAVSIVDDLIAGRLVIFDQSTGDPDMNRAAAERVMWSLFNRQKDAFIDPRRDGNGQPLAPPDVLVYAEEAHNLLPPSSAADVSNIWSRVAKEGSKYRIGIVYATQEPSSIQSNIMKNTDNWFVAHLNNSDETRELRKYYDFDDFVRSILQVPDPGFIRMRTLSNPYIVPIQVKRFQVEP
jgi:hypothetical protein